ncbi:ABC transporter substrate-binding protein [Nocardioides zeae]|uniref:ABC transporter substrate-binding protein n=1 Tax=Nocardioides imazamoxiresistens TaxID=3231893 RepID=A0ABU3PTL1_9ACTN|nr:ABC transporter substrate-binding protein [Nocardioides zeae]MDT9592140.1 ABC transporter substrate-binding protein [Nocardioides zeae]
MDEGADLEGDPIKIGFAVSLTGPQSSSVTAAPAAAHAWEQQTNSEGGIGGRPVRVEIVDTKNNASAAQAAVKTLVEDEEIVAIMLMDSVAEGAVGEYLQQENIPVIGSSGYNAAVWNQLTNFFTQAPLSSTVISSLVTAADAADAEEFVSAVCAESATCADDAASLYEPATAAYDLGYGGYVTVAANSANYTAECLSFQEKDADFIALLVTVDSAVRVMTDCIQQGYEGTFATSSTSFNPEKYGAVPNMNMVGTLNAFPWWADAAPVERFREAMEEYEEDVNYESSSATAAWSSLELFASVVSADPETITRDSVFAGYRALDGETLDGLLPQPISYAEGEPSPSIQCFWQFEFTSGEDDPTLLAPAGESGNGAEGDLATACSA